MKNQLLTRRGVVDNNNEKRIERLCLDFRFVRFVYLKKVRPPPLGLSTSSEEGGEIVLYAKSPYIVRSGTTFPCKHRRRRVYRTSVLRDRALVIT